MAKVDMKPDQKIDFEDILKAFRVAKLRGNRRSESLLFTSANIDTKIKRIRQCLLMTEGFRKLDMISAWLDSFERVKSASSQQNLLLDLQKIVDVVTLGRRSC